MKRTSIYMPMLGRADLVPVACRIGAMIVSGPIHGIDSVTGRLASTLDEQCRLAFANVRSVVETAGASIDDIIEMSFWFLDRSHRHLLETHWVAMFPEHASRPARHVMNGDLEGGALVQCAFRAVVGAP